MADPFPCPKCGRFLEQSGELTLPSGKSHPVYQCDDCTTIAEALGIKAEVALTFYVDENGRAQNPSGADDPFSNN